MLKSLVLIAAIAFTTFITLINFISISSIPEIGLGFEDKIYHVGIYMVFSFLWGYWSVLYYPDKRLVAVTLVCLIYGIALEILQHFINPNRTFDLVDLLANCLGVFFGIIIVALWTKQKVKLN